MPWTGIEVSLTQFRVVRAVQIDRLRPCFSHVFVASREDLTKGVDAALMRSELVEHAVCTETRMLTKFVSTGRVSAKDGVYSGTSCWRLAQQVEKEAEVRRKTKRRVMNLDENHKLKPPFLHRPHTLLTAKASERSLSLGILDRRLTSNLAWSTQTCIDIKGAEQRI